MDNLKAYLQEKCSCKEEGFENLSLLYDKNPNHPIFSLPDLFSQSTIISGGAFKDYMNSLDLYIYNPVTDYVNSEGDAFLSYGCLSWNKDEMWWKSLTTNYAKIEDLFLKKVIFNDFDCEILRLFKLGWKMKRIYSTSVRHSSGLQQLTKHNSITS